MDKIMNGGWTNRDSYNKMVSVNKVNNGEKSTSEFYNELYNNFGGKQVEGEFVGIVVGIVVGIADDNQFNDNKCD
jgi:tetrahydromethanopterin S-methyltransferase subunit G